MTLGPVLVHAGCALLAVLDLTARALRTRTLLWGLGQRITLRQALVIDGLGDAGCALTPYRFGGEPARMAGMLRAKVPALAAVVAIGYEFVIVWPTVGLVALLLTWLYAGEWSRIALPRLLSFCWTYWPLALLVLLVSVAAAWLGARGLRAGHVIAQTAGQARHYLSSMSWWAVVLSLPLTLASLGARIALLPTLALGLDAPPPLGATAFGSFAMLYSQLVLPTPAGAGVVDLGFLGGAAGKLGDSPASLLAAWRFYSSGLAVIFGTTLAVRIYGVAGVRGVVLALLRRPRGDGGATGDPSAVSRSTSAAAHSGAGVTSE